MKYLKTSAATLFSTLFLAATAHAQITNDIKAHIDHSFVVGKTTLPPGDYTFHMVQSTNLSAMRVSNDADHKTIEFGVSQAIDKKIPAHSHLVFRKYGDTEFLYKIFERGQDTGAQVKESSKEEARMAKTMQPVEHSEDIP
jgi:hypothetical protein